MVLTIVSELILRLLIYIHGILCTRDPFCRLVARSASTVRKHWRHSYQWSASPQQGRRRGQGPSVAEQQIQQATVMVTCQRVLTQGLGSHYIHVQGPGIGSIADIVDNPQPNVVRQLVA